MPPAEDVRFEGVVERIAGSTITGWARRVDTIDPVNVELLVGDAVAAAASADRLRLDLKENGKGEGKHAFVFQLPDAGQSFDWKTVSLRIKGSSFVLPISKTARGAAQAEGAPEPVGYVERVSPDGLSGWACIPNSAERLTIEAVIDGVVAASAVADAPRHDLAAAGVGDGRHGFKLTLPASRFAGKTLRLRLQDGRSLATLDTSLATKLARFSVEPQAASPAPAVIPARGALLGVQDGWLVGWARLEQGRTGILVTVDSRVIGETAATGLPPSAPALKLEVRGAGVPDSGVPDSGAAELAAHGFRIEVPRPLRTGARRRVLIYDAASGARINGGGQLIVFPATAEAPVARAPAPARIEPSRPLEPIAASKVTPLRAAAPATSKTLRRVAVVAWDMAHNPVGRAFLLADMAARGHEVELIGPTFAFYGGRIWPPIAGSEMRMTSFPASDLRSLVAGAVDVAMNVVCDLVVVCKPRLPSLLIGALIRNANNCPMILDIDDHELSFVKDRRPASFDELLQELSKDPTLADTPHSDLWTQFAHSLIPETEGRIVSNVALRREFGGIIVRHSRDEAVFDPALYDRQKVRAEFGYGDADRVLLFLGTPREHKGVFEVADALERLGDRRLALCVIGSIHDKRVFKRFASYKAARIALHLDQPWHRLPELVSMADAIAILQDPKHPIAEFQMPAKLSDGLALNVPVIASPVPPLQDVALSGAFQTVATAAELDAALQRLATSPPRKNDSDQGRQLFLSEFSYGVNCARLELAITTAAASPRTELPRFEQLFRLLQQRTGTALPHLVTTPPRRERRTAVRPGDPPRDLVFLWKQNDSDLYGRRSDMLCKYLLRSGKVRRIVHFDAPISAAALEQQAAAAAAEPAHQGKLIYVNTIRRVLQAADTPAMVRRTFLHRSGNRPERAMGKDLPPLSAYPDFVRQVLRDLQVDDAPVLWVSPVVMDYPAIADVIRPAFVVADVIDDQRTFPGSSEAHRQQLAAAYATILGEADAVFTNCIPVSEAFCALRPDIHVVPNGAELHAEAVNWEEPPELAGLPRPIIGYVGNLRDRIDLGLIEALARAYPQGTILLIGSAHGRPEVPALAARLPNIRLLGVKPSEEAQRIMRGFDVAIMPHLQNEQSERMNPLKLYVYFAVGVPVVTTEVANIGDLASYVNVAADKDAFLAAIARVLAGEGKAVDKAARRQVLAKVSWEARVSEIWRCIEQA